MKNKDKIEWNNKAKIGHLKRLINKVHKSLAQLIKVKKRREKAHVYVHIYIYGMKQRMSYSRNKIILEY